MKLKYLYSLLFIAVCSSFIYGQQTYRDNFSNTSYSNNDGNTNFSTNWIESGDNNSAANGYIRITGNELRFAYIWTENIRRSANLTGATAATLSFDWQTSSLEAGETLAVQASSDGTNFTTLTTFAGNTSGTFSQSIAAYISNNTTIRFQSGNNNWTDNNDLAYIDNFLITANFGPSVSINDVTVAEEAGNAIFTVTLNQNYPGGFNVNYATSNGTAILGSDYTSTTGTLSFTGTALETRTITVPILNNSYGENSENFFVNLSGGTNGIGISKSIGVGTITDTDPAIPNNTPLTLFEEFSGYFDYTTTGGSLRTQDNNTNACAITAASSNTLLSPIPAGATIRKAYLQWAHSSQNVDDTVTFEGQNVTANTIYGSNIGSGRQFYGYMSDVTSILQAIPNPSTNVYDFTGLTVDTSNTYCSSATVLGGWTLMIFYELATLPAVTINLYQGFSGESNSSSTYTLGGFFAIGASGAKTTVISWEGDQTLSNNELLTVTSGTGTFKLTGDGDNNGISVNNPFNSTIFDNTVSPAINQTNPYGLDLDTYNISPYISPGETTVSTTVQSGQDYVIVNSVLLKVPSNLITGTVFEDMNYGGGAGRSLAVSSGVGTAATTVELYNALNALVKTSATKPNGSYTIGGMANGNYRVRVVNSTVKSNRTGGAACTTCLPVQTFRRNYATVGGFTNITNRVGGANPAGTDPAAGTITNAQSLSTVTITSEGVVGLDFGFNFNTIVNTNNTGQGSLEQFIINSNNLGNTGIDIVANSIFNPVAGDDTSIFMIPPTGDALGRTADANFASGYFDILSSNGNPLPIITDDNTKIDGRTQTAYSGDTNTGVLGSGGSTVGVSNLVLPNYNRPEIQVHRDNGDVFRTEGNDIGIRNISIFANNNSGIRVDAGSLSVIGNIIGMDATGVTVNDLNIGIENVDGNLIADGNYIANAGNYAISIDGGTSAIIQKNHLANNGIAPCDDAIIITGGSGIQILQNLMETSASTAIDAEAGTGNIIISENSLTTSGQDGGNCTGSPQQMAVKLAGDGSEITNNKIYTNGGAGISIVGGTSNLISQNSIYANGTAADALGIDLNDDGVTLNDNTDVDSGPNNLENFPVIGSAFISGNNLIVSGWTAPGTTVEVFFTDINQGTASTGDNQLGLTQDYGEGQVYIGTAVEGSASDQDGSISSYIDEDGNTDNTNKYKFTLPLPPGTVLGNLVTTTGTRANSTSEFSPKAVITAYTVITNRKITYRVKTN